MIHRKYEQKLRSYTSNFPVTGIIGSRQVGKTTLAKMHIEKYHPDAIYLDLEKPSDLNMLTDAELFLKSNRNKCVVIDEIQRKPEIFPILRALIDENRNNAQYIILGSASPDLLKQSSESLAGRIAYLEIYPFALNEISDNYTIQEHWFYGGYPQAFLSKEKDVAIMWLNNFIKTYTERDLPLLGFDRSPILLFRFWTMLSNFCSRMVNYSDLSNSLDISANTVKRYIDIFEKAFLIKQITPFYKNISKRLVKSPKLLFTDTGILHRMWGLNSMEDLFGYPLLGASWENYCIMQIIIKAENKYDLSYYRTHDGAECDLILIKGLIPEFAIEIKYSSSPRMNKMNTMAFKTINAKQAFVIIPEGAEYYLTSEIKVCGLLYFLNTYLD